MTVDDRDGNENAAEAVTLTRRMREGLIEQRNNTQIDKNKIVAIKKIIVPTTKDNTEEYLKHIEFKKKAMEQFKDTNLGYVRHIADEEDDLATKYEIDDEDLSFLKQLFSKDLKSNLTTLQIVENPIVKDFEKAIAYLELQSDTSFLKIKFNPKVASPEILESITEYWKKKCRILKRPLLRYNWKTINTTPLYGDVDINKIAFRSREKKKRTMRNSYKMTAEDNYDFLNKFKEENEIALSVISMVVKRETLKLHVFQLNYCNSQDYFQNNNKIEENLTETKRLVIRVDELLKKFTPFKPVNLPVQPELVKKIESVPKPEPVVQVPEPVAVNNDTSYFISSLINEMSIYGFEFNDFKSENIKKVLNEKIRNLKQKKVTSSLNMNEKCIDLQKPSQVTDSFNPANIILLKRLAYNTTNEVYIEKVEPERLKSQKDIYFDEDFTSDSLIKRNLSYFDQNFSHCNLSRNESFNPFVYCSKSNLNLSSNIFENLKLQRYNDLLEGYFCEDEKQHDIYEILHDINNEASQYIEQIKIGENFKNYVRNIKKAY